MEFDAQRVWAEKQMMVYCPMVEAATTKVEQLEKKLVADWSHLRRARKAALEKKAQLRGVLSGLDSEDTSVVVSGSLARDEIHFGQRHRLDPFNRRFRGSAPP